MGRLDSGSCSRRCTARQVATLPTDATYTVAQGERGVLIKGFTLTGGQGHVTRASSSYSCGSGCTGTYNYATYCGGGLHASGSDLSLEDVTVKSNQLVANSTTLSGYDYSYVYSFGGGVCAFKSTVGLTGVRLEDNYAHDGGGIYAYNGARVTVKQSFVLANRANDGAGAQVDRATLTYTNVVSGWNVAQATGGAILSSGGSVAIVNSTFGYDNAAHGVLYASSSGTITMDSSIVTGSHRSAGVTIVGGNYTGTSSNIYGNAGGTYRGTTDLTGIAGNLSLDPVIDGVSDDRDLTNDRWILGTGSPSRDAGNPAPAMNDPDGTVNDQGAFGGPMAGWND